VTRARSGFTLIELMIVVAIVGILAAIAGPIFYSQMQRTRMVDAFRTLDDMRRAEASYFAHYSQYCPVGWNPPTTPSGTTLRSLVATDPAWNVLGVNSDGPQRFQYQVITGIPGQAAPPGVLNMPLDEFWFLAQAQGDLDADGVTVFVETTSHSDRVYIGRGLDGPYLAQGWE
jgi:prepilin-type N-terminal cleavage/methylation domain-containing protein